MFLNWFVFRVLYQPSSNLCIRVLCPWFADTYDDEQKEDWWKESIGGGGEGDLNNWLQVEELGATSPGWFCSGMFVFGCRLDWLMPDSNSLIDVPIQVQVDAGIPLARLMLSLICHCPTRLNHPKWRSYLQCFTQMCMSMDESVWGILREPFKNVLAEFVR